MKTLLCLFSFIFLITTSCFARDSTTYVFHINKLPPEGVLLDKGWKFTVGDNPEYASSDYDDSRWQAVDPTQDIHDIPALWKNGIVWFRLQFTSDSSLLIKPITIIVQQTGASEIYLNGQLVKKYGIISSKAITAAALPWNEFIVLEPGASTTQTLAVRFALQQNLPYINGSIKPNPVVSLRLMEAASLNYYLQSNIHLYLDYLRAGVFLILAILHFALFQFYAAQKANLYFFIYCLASAIQSFLVSLAETFIHTQAWRQYSYIFVLEGTEIEFLFFIYAVYLIFDYKKRLVFWVLVCSCVFIYIYICLNNRKGAAYGDLFSTFILLEAVRIILLQAKGRRGGKIVIVGVISFIIFYTYTNLTAFFGVLYAGPNLLFVHLAFNISVLSLPVAISIYLALEASHTSRSLEEKLEEVQLLSQKNLEQEQEKQQLLTTENERLEQQVLQRTAELKQSLENLKSTQAQLIQSEKMASLGQLTAGIAHEIQNPLNFVNNFSEVNRELIAELKEEIEKGDLEEVKTIASNIEENEQKIIHHGKRADSIVKGMLQHSKASTGKRELTDINVLVDESLRLSYHGLRAKDKDFNAEIKTDLDDSIGKINVVPQDISRVLLNLFNNAFYAVNEKKRLLNGIYDPAVSVYTKKINDKVEIQVKDNGNGISQAIIDKIFQPFFTTKPTGQGTGLGLSLSYDIIKAHGGEIKVESKEGEGSEFLICLLLNP